MDRALLQQLRKITEEERNLLDGQDIRQDLYTSRREFVVDSAKLLEKGKLIEIRPHTRFAHFPRHRHNYVELVYMCAGQTTHIIDREETIVLQEGDLLFLHQNVYHEILPAREEDIAVNFVILPAFFDRPLSMIERENVLRDFLVAALSGEVPLTRYLHIPAKGIVPVENLMENMIWTLIEGVPGVGAINQTTMGLLLMNLSRFADSINRSAPQQEQNTVFSILQYIDTHYRAGTLQEIAGTLGQPEYSISRLLTKHLGQNFKQLLQARKLQQAVYLLTNTQFPIDAVRAEIGYDNSSYFYRKFKERYGCSPKEFRERQREETAPPGV